MFQTNRLSRHNRSNVKLCVLQRRFLLKVNMLNCIYTINRCRQGLAGVGGGGCFPRDDSSHPTQNKLNLQ